MKLPHLQPLLAAAGLFVTLSSALGQKSIISANKQAGVLTLVENSRPVARIHVSSTDYPAVIRAAHDLAADFGRVTGHNMTLTLTNSTGKAAAAAAGTSAIIVGTIGESALIDSLVANKKLNISGIVGKWESFRTTLVDNPIPGVSRALVIAGSDKRGTIFGVYEVSEQIGVSPWYYWADVPPQQHKALYALKTTLQRGEPSVKYRGIFLNDEQPALTGWVNDNFPRGEYGPGYNHEFYSRVFELLLRLRANLLWPTMWDSMFAVDDALNQKTADMYGIVMSTSHTEPLQMSTKEWNTLGNGTWDYTSNSGEIYKYWQKGVERAKDYENIWTIGMRGNGDNNLGEGVVTELLSKVVKDQREILANVLGVDDVATVPQVWCLYKDIQAYYEAGMRVPDNVTLLWTDDNWGNVRRLPSANETHNQAGIYYHFDYVGDPRNYKWINTVSLTKTAHELHLTYERGAREIWVVNVGDLKPLEVPIDYFLNLAYDFDRWGGVEEVDAYTALWAAREFGTTHAAEIASIMSLYGTYAARRKYELVDSTTYSPIHYHEAELVLSQWRNLSARAKAVHSALPAAYRPTFFELVLHPTKAAYTVYDIHVTTGRNNLYASQRRTSANALAQHVMKQFDEDAVLTREYNGLLGGKWNHMMDQPHLGYNYWQQPMRNTLAPLAWVQAGVASVAGHMGVAIEGSNGTVPGDDRYNTVAYGNNTLVLPALDPFAATPYRTIEIFSRGTEPFFFNVTPHNSWVHVQPKTGFVDPQDPATDTTVRVSVDWDAAPEGYNIGFLDITSSASYGDFGAPSVNLPINKTAVPTGFTGFVESDKHVSIEASHASRNTSNGEVHYSTLPNLGRTGDAVTIFPVTADTQDTASGPRLDYDLHLFTVPSYGANITVYLGGALNNQPGRPLKYAIALDDETPQEVQYIPNLKTPLAMPDGWLEMVADGNVWKHTTRHNMTSPGKKTLKLWALEPSVVFQKVVMDLGGVRPSYLGPPESVRL